MNEFLPYIPQLLNSTISGFSYLLPEIVLVLTFIIVILSDLFVPGKRSSLAFYPCIVGILLSIITGFVQNLDSRILLFSNTMVLDSLSISFKSIFSFVTILFAFFIRYNPALQNHKKGVGDMYMLLPAVLIGLNLMSMSASLLMIYISVEMVSIASYLMVGYASGNDKQTEAAMKYVLFGSICSAVMLYGMSLLYALTGSINIGDANFLNGLKEAPNMAVTLALSLVLVGVGFKLSFVPFHFWIPDVYEGAPTPVTAFISTAPKIAGFAVLIRFIEPFHMFELSNAYSSFFDFKTILSVGSLLTMIVGNFSAIWQNNVKRMLAYSSVGHTGFALMAVISFEGGGFKSLIFYMAVYAIMNMAAFMLVDEIESQTGITDIRKYKGLGKILKLEFVCFVIVLIALTGLPPTAGFVAKLLIFSSGFEYYSSTGSVWMLGLLITGALTTVVSLFYYLKIPLYAFLKDSEIEFKIAKTRNPLTVLILILTVLLILFGIFPDALT